jgi:hypothetical protein
MSLWTFLIDSTTAYFSNLCLLRVSLSSPSFARGGVNLWATMHTRQSC